MPSHDHLTREDLAALVSTSRQLSAEVGLDELLDLILATACALTDSPDSALFLHDPNRNSLFFAAATGEDAEQALSMFGRDSLQHVPLESVAGRAFETGDAVIVDDLDREADHFKGTDRQTGHRSMSMLCVPLSVAGVRIGAMQLLNKRAGRYADRDLELVEVLGSQAAVAIRNATLVEDLLAHMGLGSAGKGASAFALIEEMSGPPHVEELTVMFADMRSFTQLTNVLSPQQLQDLLNDYLTMLCDQVVLHDGVVNKLVGDGILALFRGGDHPHRAVECALAMGEQFDRLRRVWDRASNVALDFLDIGIGIATDAVLLATLGNRQVRDFTPIGPAVNLANAFEFAARDGRRIFCDQRTYESVQDLVVQVDQPEVFQLTKPGQGVAHPYKRYELKRRQAQPGAVGRVFLSHNSDDKPAVRELAHALRQRDIPVWLDEDELVPGRPWQAALEEIIETAGSAAVIVGLSGLGPWEVPEMRAALSQFVERQMPVIPVLIPGAPRAPALPLFLREFTWVDLRDGVTDQGLDRLEWGIRGVKPSPGA
jgi:adenylate cyclase